MCNEGCGSRRNYKHSVTADARTVKPLCDDDDGDDDGDGDGDGGDGNLEINNCYKLHSNYKHSVTADARTVKPLHDEDDQCFFSLVLQNTGPNWNCLNF